MMQLLVIAVGRAVPVLLALSVILVLARLAHDRYARPPWLPGRAVFACVLGLGLACLAPGTMRSIMLVSADTAYYFKDWQRADHSFDLHHRLGGKETERSTARWATSLNNLGQYGAVLSLLRPRIDVSSLQPAQDMQPIEQLASALYFAGELKAAEETLAAIPPSSLTHVAHYFSGRVQEAQGRVELALRHYEASHAQSPLFYPPVYQLARLQQSLGRGGHVAALRSSVRQLDTELGALESGGAGQDEGLPPREFRVTYR